MKQIFFLLLFFAFISNSNAQRKVHFSISMSNHYSDIIYVEENNNTNPVTKGRYGFGGELRYLFGNQESRIHFGVGFAYNRIGTRNSYNWPNLSESSKQKENIHLLLLPIYTFINWNSNWYSGLLIEVESPYKTTWSSIHYNNNGQEIERYEGGSNVNRRRNRSIGFGLVTGENIWLKNGLCIFIEGKFKVFDVISFIKDDEDDIFHKIYPFLVGVNTGLKF